MSGAADGAGTHTESRKGKEEGEVHHALPPHQRVTFTRPCWSRRQLLAARKQLFVDTLPRAPQVGLFRLLGHYASPTPLKSTSVRYSMRRDIAVTKRGPLVGSRARAGSLSLLRFWLPDGMAAALMTRASEAARFYRLFHRGHGGLALRSAGTAAEEDRSDRVPDHIVN